MTGLPYCGNDCLSRKIRQAEAIPISASVRPESGWKMGDKVIRAISASGHTPAHPLYLTGAEPLLQQRKRLLREMMAHPVANAVPVTAVCDCSFETSFVEAIPLRDFGLGPDSNRLIPPLERRVRWGPEALHRFLAELAKGLRDLHQIGIAHGDPVLMNALVAGSQEPKTAIWTDFNTIRPASAEAVAIDTAAYIDLLLWPALFEQEIYSPSLVADIVELNAAAPDVLAALTEALQARREDCLAGDRRAAYQALLQRTPPNRRQDLFGSVQARIRAAMAPAYFLDQTTSDQSTRFLQTVLGAERTRHKLLEEEVTRLHYLRFHGEVETLKRAHAEVQDWARQLQEAVDYYKAREVALQEEADRDAVAAQARSQEAVDYYKTREPALLAQLRDAVAAQARSQEAVNDHKARERDLERRIRDLQGSWSWRLTRPLRRILGALRG